MRDLKECKTARVSAIYNKWIKTELIDRIKQAESYQVREGSIQGYIEEIRQSFELEAEQVAGSYLII